MIQKHFMYMLVHTYVVGMFILLCVMHTLVDSSASFFLSYIKMRALRSHSTHSSSSIRAYRFLHLANSRASAQFIFILKKMKEKLCVAACAALVLLLTMVYICTTIYVVHICR